MKVQKKKLKNKYLSQHDIKIKDINKDLKAIKQTLKNTLSVNYPGKFQLFKNKQSGRLYLTVTTINFNISIIGKSDKKTLQEQMNQLFPEYNFFENKKAGGFNLFPGMTHSIYGFSDQHKIKLNPSSVILQF